MSLDNEAVRLAYLGKANKRGIEQTLNVPVSRKFSSHLKGGAMNRVIGGAKKQTRKDREDERLAMKIEEMEGSGYSYGGAKQKKMSKAQMKKMAEKMGEEYGKNIMEMDEEAKLMVGSGGFGDFMKGFQRGFKMVSDPVKAVAKFIPHPGVQAGIAGLNAVGLGMSGGKKQTKAQMKKMAEKLGEEYGKNNMEIDEEAKLMVGSGGFGDFMKGFKRGFKMVSDPVKAVAKFIPDPRVQAGIAGLNAVGLGMSGGKKQRRSKPSVSDNRRKRGALVSKLMKEKGMTLGEASKFIKQNNLM